MHPWAFRARFRRAAFGWKGTRLAIERIHEALPKSAPSHATTPPAQPRALSCSWRGSPLP